MKKSVSLTLVLILICMNCFAHNGDKVQIYPWDAHKFYSVPQIYDMPIRYAIDPRLEPFKFEFQQHSFTHNLARDIEIALEQWRNAPGLIPSAPRFIRVATPQEADLVFGIANHPPSDITPGAVFYSHMRTSIENNARVMLIPDNVSSALQSLVSMFPRYSTENLIRMMFRFFVIHESGHIMGFDHPDSGRMLSDVLGPWGPYLPNVIFTGDGLPVADYRVPHIMTRHLDTYLIERGIQLDRPLTPENITISPVEAAAFRFVLTAPTQTCPPNFVSSVSSVSSRGATPAVRSDKPGSITCSWAPLPIIHVVSLLLN